MSRKLSGEATLSELTELNDFTHTQANVHLYVQAVEEYWKIPPENDEDFLEATYQLHINRLKQKGFNLEAGIETEEPESLYFGQGEFLHDKKSYRKNILIASSFILFIAFLLFNLDRFQNSPVIAAREKIARSEVSTKSGSRSKIQLPDGTSVWLNGSSILVYDNLHFGEKIREVTLTGEAYFDVVKNRDRPFIIHANRVNIKVTGTAFNVKAYPGEKNTETSLIRGSIEVTLNDRKEKIMMKPNDKLIISNEVMPAEKENAIHKKGGPVMEDSTCMLMRHLTITNDENRVEETAWVNNILVFDKETFEALATRMERWYGVTIRFSDDELKLQKLTGSFEKETIAAALKALQISTPFFKYKINNQSITIFK